LPPNRGAWAQRTLEDYRPLLEQLAGSLGTAEVVPKGDEVGVGPDDQLAAMLGPMLEAMQPMMVAMTAGSMVGHMARRALGQYDLPIPRRPSDELMIVVPNLEAFGKEWSLPAEDLRLWICLHEIAHHTVLGVPHVRSRLESLLREYTTKFRNDPEALGEALGDIDLTGGPESMAQLQRVLGEPGALLGAIQSTEALRRRRVEAGEADRFVERLLGLELTQAVYDRGAAFVEGVVERAGPEGLARLWEGEQMLPSPPEVDAPGLWLARIELLDD